MYPELFKIPFTHDLTIKSYGLMMVIGFLLAVSVIRRLSRSITPDSNLITSAALYSLIAGVVGARLFYVVHYFDQFKDDLFSVFAIWKGGLELLGGVISAITVIFFYLWRNKLPIRRYLDILAIGLFLALTFGRIGCFLNGCCFGKPTDLPWAVRFPYNSHAYNSQIRPDTARNRPEPYLKLPSGFFAYVERNGLWYLELKPFEKLSEQQKTQVTNGTYRSLAVHPTQLYSSASALLCSLLLYLFWRKYQKTGSAETPKRLFAKPGCTFALMFIIYGPIRFLIEFLRDDNPFENAWWIIYKGASVSQNLGIYMVIFGVILMLLFQSIRTDKMPLVPQGQQ